MNIRSLHPWNLTPMEAVVLQTRLRGEVVRVDRLDPTRLVAGVDAAYDEGGRITRAAVAVLSFPGLEFVEGAVARLPTAFPYVPGLLSFREAPAILQALQQLTVVPDLLLCDGQGIAHPRRFGLASHLGLLADIPAIGVAKTRLIGEHEQVPEERGAWRPLLDRDELVGAVLRTQTRVKPIYVSVGHRISLETAIRMVLACAPNYRLPETTRWANRLASQRPASSEQSAASNP
jgi:deoxyribonuclease V